MVVASLGSLSFPLGHEAVEFGPASTATVGAVTFIFAAIFTFCPLSLGGELGAVVGSGGLVVVGLVAVIRDDEGRSGINCVVWA